MGKLLSQLITFAFVVVAWVFFRAQTVTQAQNILTHLFAALPSTLVISLLCQSTLAVSLGIYAIYLLIFSRKAIFKPKLLNNAINFLLSAKPAQAIVYLSIFIAAVAFSPTKSSPFIYFQF